MVGRAVVELDVLLPDALHGAACCADAGPPTMVESAELVFGPPPWLGMLCWCWAPVHGRRCGAGPPSMVGGAVLVRGPLPWSSVLCWCSAPLHCRAWCVGAWPPSMGECAVLNLGLPHGQACCAAAVPASMVGRAVLELGPPPCSGVLFWCLVRRDGGASCSSAWPPCMVWCGVLALGPLPSLGMLS